MPASPQIIEWLIEELAPLGHIAARTMFGGAGVYCDGAMFGLIADDAFFLKTDEAGQPAFIAEGLGPFTYTTKRGPGQLTSYWKAPERLSDDRDELLIWANRAVTVARAAAAKQAQKTKSASGTRPRRSG